MQAKIVFMTEIILVIGLVGLAFVGLCIKIILLPNGRFGSEDVGANKAMRERGIHCTKTQDRQAQRGNEHHLDVKNM